LDCGEVAGALFDDVALLIKHVVLGRCFRDQVFELNRAVFDAHRAGARLGRRDRQGDGGPARARERGEFCRLQTRRACGGASWSTILDPIPQGCAARAVSAAIGSTFAPLPPKAPYNNA
jgi:hypothetical protein